jgi:RimJ/RimL family protein N-acetyltransferase
MPFTIPDLSTHIETERLYLRAYRHGDGRWYHPMALRNRDHLQRFEAGNAVMRIRSEEDAERIMREFVVDWLEGTAFFLGVFRRVSEEFVGQVYVGVPNRDLPEFEVGFFADAAHEGQGYVSEAVTAVLSWLFRRLGAHRVRLECGDTNERSVRVAQRCGFVREGHIRENRLWSDGSITGTLHYGLLCTEYPIDPRTSRARANT